MAEDCCFLHKDALVVKSSPKNFPFVMRRVGLAFVVVYGAYMCSVCLKKGGILTGPNLMKISTRRLPCNDPNIPQSEIPYVHYPLPTTYSREECRCTPVRYFAILSRQRSGSGWFETLLNSHVNISSNGEIFSVRSRRDNVSSITNTLDKVYNLDWHSSASKNECTAAVGFKWMLNQGLADHYDEIVEYFTRRGVSALFLFRRNELRRYVSILANMHDQVAKQINGTHIAHVHSKDEADVLARYKPRINVASLISYLKQSEDSAVDALTHFKSTRHILLYYEDIMKNQNKLMDVLDFLKVPQRRLVSNHVKIHTRPLAHQIENWVDVYNSLKGTKYENLVLAQ